MLFMIMLLGGISLQPHAAGAQTPDNIVLENSISGIYRGYALAPFYFACTAGFIPADGYVAVGSKEDTRTSAHDSVNIVLIPDETVVGPGQAAGFNLGISGATDIRAVAITNIGQTWYSTVNLFAVTLQVRGGGKKTGS